MQCPCLLSSARMWGRAHMSSCSPCSPYLSEVSPPPAMLLCLPPPSLYLHGPAGIISPAVSFSLRDSIACPVELCISQSRVSVGIHCFDANPNPKRTNPNPNPCVVSKLISTNPNPCPLSYLPFLPTFYSMNSP